MSSERAMLPEPAEAPRRVLCVRLDGMGDLLMTTPAIARLRASWPDARLGLLTSPAGAAAATCMPYIDDVFVFEAPWMKHGTPASPELCLAFAQTLRDQRYDMAIIFSVFSQTVQAAALLCYLAGIPRRVAYARDKSYGLLTDPFPDPDTESAARHEVERQIQLVARLGAQSPPETRLLAWHDAASAAADRIAAAGIDNTRPWVLLHPGASASSRRYPCERWSRVIALLLAQDVGVALAGGAEDAPMVDALLAEHGRKAPLITGLQTFGEFVALIGQAPLLLCNNSGPSHVASAVGTPIVCLYALTNPQHRPWGRRGVSLSINVPCRSCASSTCFAGRNACIADVQPEAVVDAVFRVMAWPRPAAVPQ